MRGLHRFSPLIRFNGLKVGELIESSIRTPLGELVVQTKTLDDNCEPQIAQATGVRKTLATQW